METLRGYYGVSHGVLGPRRYRAVGLWGSGIMALCGRGVMGRGVPGLWGYGFKGLRGSRGYGITDCRA